MLWRRISEEHGIDVVSMQWLGLSDTIEIARVDTETVYHLVREVDGEDARAVFPICIVLRTIEVIDALEDDLQKPVISSNQPAMRHMIILSGVTGPDRRLRTSARGL